MRPSSRHVSRVLVLIAVAALVTVALGLGAGAATASSHHDQATEAEPGGWWDILPRPEWKTLPIVKLPAGSAWFEVHKVAPRTYAIYEPGNWQEVISYLIVGTRRALLWDTGMDIGDMKLVVGQLTKKPVIVLSSHTHSDHIGGNYQFDEVWNLDNDFARANAASGVSHEDIIGGVGPESMNPNVPLPARFDYETYWIRPYTVTKWVHEGDTIDLGGGRTLRIIASPGHSPDGISLLDARHRLLFVGDVFYNSDLYAHIGGADLAEYTATAAKLAGFVPQVRHIMPSHNIARISSQWLVKMDEAFQAIADGTATEYTDYPDWGVRVYDFGYFRIDVRLADVTPTA